MPYSIDRIIDVTLVLERYKAAMAADDPDNALMTENNNMYMTQDGEYYEVA